jgi:hypothetical protein
MLIACAPPHIAGIFNITEADPTPLDTALRAFLDAREIAATHRCVPFRLERSIADAAESVALLTGRLTTLTRHAVRPPGLERTPDISAARERLDYQPTATSFECAADW